MASKRANWSFKRPSSKPLLNQERKSAQRGSFWDGHPVDILCHSRGYHFGQGGQDPGKKKQHFGADIHDPKARMSRTLRGFQKLRSEKLWAEFLFPIEGDGKGSQRRAALLYFMLGSDLRCEALRQVLGTTSLRCRDGFTTEVLERSTNQQDA